MGMVQAAQKATPNGQEKMNPDHLLTNLVTVVRNSMQTHKFIDGKSNWNAAIGVSKEADKLFLSLQERFNELNISRTQLTGFVIACVLLYCILPANFKVSLWTLKAVVCSIFFLSKMSMMVNVAKAAVNYLAGENVYNKNVAHSVVAMTYIIVRRMISRRLAILSALCSYNYFLPVIMNQSV